MTTKPHGRLVPQWVREFGTGYAVPPEVSNTLLDQSWHNDVSPSFTHPDAPADDDHDLRLWVEHPEPEMREYAGFARFTVTDGRLRDADQILGGEIGAHVQTDDLADALRVLAVEAAKVQAERANAVLQWKDEDEIEGVNVGPAWLVRPSGREDKGWMTKPDALALARELGCKFEEV